MVKDGQYRSTRFFFGNQFLPPTSHCTNTVKNLFECLGLRDLSDVKFSEEHDGVLQNCPKTFVSKRKNNGLKDVGVQIDICIRRNSVTFVGRQVEVTEHVP